MEGSHRFRQDVHTVTIIPIMQVTHQPQIAVTVTADPVIQVIAVRDPLQDFQEVEALVTRKELAPDELQ